MNGETQDPAIASGFPSLAKIRAERQAAGVASTTLNPTGVSDVVRDATPARPFPSLAQVRASRQASQVPQPASLTGVTGPTGARMTREQLLKRVALHKQLAAQPIETRLEPGAPGVPKPGPLAGLGMGIDAAVMKGLDVGRAVASNVDAFTHPMDPARAASREALNQAVQQEVVGPQEEASPTGAFIGEQLATLPLFEAGVGPAEALAPSVASKVLPWAARVLGRETAPLVAARGAELGTQAVADAAAMGIAGEGTPEERLKQMVVAPALGTALRAVPHAIRGGVEALRPREVPSLADVRAGIAARQAERAVAGVQADAAAADLMSLNREVPQRTAQQMEHGQLRDFSERDMARRTHVEQIVLREAQTHTLEELLTPGSPVRGIVEMQTGLEGPAYEGAVRRILAGDRQRYLPERATSPEAPRVAPPVEPPRPTLPPPGEPLTRLGGPRPGEEAPPGQQAALERLGEQIPEAPPGMETPPGRVPEGIPESVTPEVLSREMARMRQEIAPRGPEAPPSGAGGLPPSPPQPPGPRFPGREPPPSGPPGPEVEAFFARTESPPPAAKRFFPKLAEEIRKTFVTSYKLRGNHEVYDPKLGNTNATTSFSDARNRIRLTMDSGRHAAANAIDLMRSILQPEGKSLTKDQYELLRRKVFVEDLLETARRGEATPLDPENLTREKARVDALLASDPTVQQAYARDQEIWQAVAQDLIKRKKLSPEQVREHYVHHEVMDFLKSDSTAGIGRPQALRNVLRKYLKRRAGSEKDIYTNYLDVRYRSLAKVIRDNMIDDAVTEIADRYAVPKEVGERLGYVPFNAEQIWTKERLSGDRQVMRFMSDLAREMPENVRRDLMLRSEEVLLKKKVFIHPDLADTLSELRDNFQDLSALGKATGMWKQTMLNKNPIRYNFNNLIGDFERAWNATPEVFGKNGPDLLRRALRDIRDAQKGKVSRDYRLAQRESVVDSGEVYHEIGSIKESDLFRGIDPTSKSAWLHPLRVASQSLRNASTARENLLRLMVFYENLDRMRAGKPLIEGVSDIRGMSDPVAVAGKVSREALGDYGDMTPREQRLRRGIMPFYSWLKINTSFWPTLFKRKGVGVGVRSMTIRGAMKTTSVVAKATALYAAASAWNNTVMQDEEEKLPEDVRRRFHIVTDMKDSKGKQIVITEPTAFSDFLDSVGLEGVTTDMAQLLRGQLSASKLKEQAIKRPLAPVRKIASRITPAVTAPVEAVTSKKFYPDPLNPSPSQMNNPISRFLSGAGVGEFISPRDALDAYKRSWVQLGAIGIRRYDEGLSSLRNTEESVRRFREAKGYKTEPGSEGPATDANRALLYALADKDFSRASSLLKKTNRLSFSRYLASRDPLRLIAVKDRPAFGKEVGSSGLAQLNRARRFLKEIGARTVEN